MNLGKIIGHILQGVFLESAGSWGASITLDADGNIVDEFDEKRQKVMVRIRNKPNTKEPDTENSQ